MMKRVLLPLVGLVVACAPPAGGQMVAAPERADDVLAAIDRIGTEDSRVRELAQVLLDSIGPRLTGSPGMRAAGEWAVKTYASWGIGARQEPYGQWENWRRGITHLDLLEPRVRTLEATMLAWSPGSNGVRTGPAVLMPAVADLAEFERWLPTAAGKMVLLDAAEVTCRPVENWEEWGRPETVQRLEAAQEAAEAAWTARLRATGLGGAELLRRLEAAGAAALLTSNWSQGWGVSKVYSAGTRTVPMINLGCEDYGLVFRLAENEQGPVLRLQAEAESLGTAPVANTIATIPGRELPNEFVLLSAHFDSWDGSSGATDNGTGTVVMMEAMRILKQVLPNPRRTIIAAHWNGEEQGLNGSSAFAADHPEIVEGLQVLLNQDNGTGRIATVQMEGFAEAETVFRRWLGQVPDELASGIELRSPGTPSRSGSDHSSFICHGAPAFFLSSRSWDYGTYTWHTDRDTFDKLVFEEVQNNAKLVAMLAYLASESPERFPRDRAPVAASNGWPACRVPDRGR